MDVQDHAVAVDIGDAEASPFEEPQSTDVDGDEADAVDGKTNAAQDAADLLAAEDDGELLLAWRGSEIEQRPCCNLPGFSEAVFHIKQWGASGSFS